MIKTAIKFMMYEKSKSVGILIAIFIAIFLIGQQLSTLGFLKSLMSSTVDHSDPENADIWVVTDQTESANSLKTIKISLVNQLKSVEGVQETYPVIVSSAMLKFSNGQFANVQLIGSEPPAMIMGPSPELIEEGERSAILNPLSFTCEINDEKNYHHPVELGMEIELNGKRCNVVALTRNLRGYGSAMLYSTIDNVREVSGLSSDEINAVVVKVENKEEVEEVCRSINKKFRGITAWPRQKIAKSTIDVTLKQTSMGASFASLVAFAVISGFFIIGLTLYTSTFDRVKDYGTLKAIGATNNYISRLVLTQAALYGLCGYVLAVAILFVMKFSVAKAGLIMIITPQLLISLLLMTLFISVGGSLFAVRKLSKLEPASVFK